MNKIEIGLIGYSFFSLNLGVGALTIGQVECVKQVANQLNIDYHITSFETSCGTRYDLEPSDYYDKISLVKYDPKHIINNIFMLKKMDIIFDITGGDSFSDIYGWKRYVAMLLIKTAAILSGKPYYTSPQTVGPFNAWYSKITSQFVLAHSKRIFIRDKKSRKAISKKLQKNVVETADLGFSMPYKKTAGNDKKTLGFNVSGLLFNSGAYINSNIDYKKLCDEVIKSALSAGYDVELVPHVCGKDAEGIDNDTGVCEQLSKKYGLRMSPVFSNPMEAKSYISHFDCFIGSRMHATIAAVSSGVPTIPLAYSRKFKGVFSLIGYPYVIDLNQGTFTDVIYNIKKLIINIKKLQEKIKVANDNALQYKNQYIKIISKDIDNIING